MGRVLFPPFIPMEVYMLNEVLQSLNNYFVHDYCDLNSITTTTITVDDASKFINGQYCLIIGSKMNDGVYLITNINGLVLTLDAPFDFVPETSEDMIACSLAIPRAVLSLVSEIEAYNEKNDGSIKSESLGDYSVSYQGNQDASWITVFRRKLAPYKKTYLNLPYKKAWLYDRWY